MSAFQLTGAHGRVACFSCHGTENTKMDKPQCGRCHADPHRGRFGNILLADNKTIDCTRCHVTVDWFAERFDHEKDSRFPLLGGHQKVACTTCHQVQDSNNQRLLLYKSVSIECVVCHSGPVSSQYVGTPTRSLMGMEQWNALPVMRMDSSLPRLIVPILPHNFCLGAINLGSRYSLSHL